MGSCPLLLGSGKFVTPCARMQRAKASASWAFVDCESPKIRAADEPPAAVDDGLAPNAAAGRAAAVVATMAAATRAVCVHTCHGRRMTRILFIVPAAV